MTLSLSWLDNRKKILYIHIRDHNHDISYIFSKTDQRSYETCLKCLSLGTLKRLESNIV